LADNSDEWHRQILGNRVYSSTMMIHQFQYPKVTPIRPGTGTGTGPKPGAPPGGGSRPRG
jgi:hypothetical protein